MRTNSDLGLRRGPNPVLLLAVIMLLGPLVGVRDAAAAGHSWAGTLGPKGEHGAFCSTTARVALDACRAGAKDDYWTAVGTCTNVTDRDARRECLADAAATLKETRDECRDQRDARLDVCDQIGEGRYDPAIDPAAFVDPLAIGGALAANPFMPVVSGATWDYVSGAETTHVAVTDEVKEILGVPCIVVHDTVSVSGEVVEDTRDFLAQDVDGNVWYFGETSQGFEDGELVTLEGSWMAGVEGAKPGVLMFKAPEVGAVYRQEFALGDGEDMGEVLATNGDESTSAASCGGACVVTRDFTPMEPGVEEHKYYVPGVGLLLELDPDTGTRTELVGYTMP
jgi:hypothetical protein